jgi:hypothetical protein
MDLTPYLDSVRDGVANAAALADEPTQQVAHRLSTAVESSTRLALIQALSDAASTISAELAPSSVELRMVGADPEFAVTVQNTETEPTLLLNEPSYDDGSATVADDSAEADDEPVSRLTLRLPQSVKVKVDEMAAADGISTNAWLIRAVMDALSDRPGQQDWPQPPRVPGAGALFGPNGPFGPHGVFGPHGPFGPSGERSGARHGDAPRPPRGNVQGWVR